jgi:ABC-2 type transport system ATP-binding protein
VNILEAQHIVKRYSNHTALNDVSISIPRGCIFGLLGPNGAGKTSLIRIITQITAPDSGTVYFNGEPLSPKHISQIGYLPEERGLYKKMKVGEQLLYLTQLKGISKAEAMDKLKVWFKKFEIQTWWNKHVEDLSKGMQQKVQFVATVLHNPSLIILDEPFSGFDPINANLIKDEILQLKQQGSTIIFSTHRMESVEELCDYIALINKSQKFWMVLQRKLRIYTGPILLSLRAKV